MIFLQALELILILFLMPVCMGFALKHRGDSCKLAWIQGLVMEWAIIFVVTLPCIIKGYTLSLAIKGSGTLILAGSLVGIASFCMARKGVKKLGKVAAIALTKLEILYLALFLGIVLFQLYKAIFYVYVDGDDAYYISVAVSAASSDKMYMHEAYTGFGTTPNYRYALAPFPMWLSMISRITGIASTIVAHTIIPPVMIVLSYVIYWEISKELFVESREKQYLFLVLVAIFVMFENVSASTQGSFLLGRSRQGKEALANVILPYMFLLIYKLIKKNLELGFKDWLGLLSVCLAASFTSVLGNMLAPLMILFALIMAVVRKKNLKTLLALAATIIPCAAVMLLYIRL